MNDRAEVRVAGPDGGTLYRGKTTPALGYGNDFVVRTTDGGEVRTRQQIVLPAEAYQRLRNRSVRMEIDYSLTLFALTSTATVAAADGSQRISAFGRCRSQIDDDGDEVEFACIRSGPAPTCVSATLESPTWGRAATQWSCDPDYSPYQVHLYPDATSRFMISVKVPEVAVSSGRAAAPSRIEGALLRVKSYRPAAHVTRRLVIPQVRVIP
jgi:hypothetical protein